MKAIKSLVLASLTLLVATLAVPAQTVLISTGSDWKYLDDGTDQGTSWFQPTFDDASWASGPAQLGYGDGDEATTNSFGPDDQNKFVTTYYRHTFNATGTAGITNLRARILRDDGAVAYLNGVEIFREHITNGPIDYLTFADSPAVGGADESTFFPHSVDPALLADGPNVLAVEIHQVSGTSSDISFDFELVANPVPEVAITSPTNGQTITAINIPISATAVAGGGTNVTLVEFFQGAAKIGEAIAAPFGTVWTDVAPGNYTLTAKVTDSAGMTATSTPITITVLEPPPSLVARGSVWRYNNLNIDLGTTWREPTFDDSGWPGSGPAPLGNGVLGGGGTTIPFGTLIDIRPPGGGNDYPTIYFRHTFNVPDASIYSSLVVELLRDDSAVVWLNGVKIVQDGIGGNPVFSDYASNTADAAQEVTYYTFSADIAALRTGQNVLAVEVHNTSPTSSDLGLDLSLIGDAAPSAAITEPINGAAFTLPTNITISAVASDFGGGTISRVEFYAGSTLLGDDAAAPYSFLWTNAIEGVVALTAVAIDNNNGRATSAPVNITLVDPNPPSIVSVTAGTTNTVRVQFSKAVAAAGATNAANFQIDNGVVVQNAAIDGAANRVALTTSQLLPNTTYTLTVNGIEDLAGNPIEPDSQFTFELLSFDFTPIGATGSSVPVAGGFNVTSTGADIGGNTDQFSFNFAQRVGDFDVKVRVASVGLSDAWAKAGLMARESLTGGSRYAAAITTPSITGSSLQYRSSTSGTTTTRGSFPTTYPNTWLRLRRSGSVFTAYAGFDGQTWSELGRVTLVMASSLYVGMAVSSHDATTSTTAEFRNYASVAGNPPAGGIAFPREPLGPSSRRGPLAITEIMYHPRSVPGSPNNSLEFIELYNSQPWDEDISGWRISGDVDFTFVTNTTIKAGGFLVVARDPSFVESHYGISGVLGPWDGVLASMPGISTNSLPGGRGTVRLRNRANAVILEVKYEGANPWPIAADGAGHSLVLARPSYGEGQPAAWSASAYIDGSPGRDDDFAWEPINAVVINEFLAHTDPPLEDFIELYNHGNQEVNLSGAYLTDEGDTNKFQIPDGTTIPPRGFVSFTASQATIGFALRAAGERIYLINSNATRVIDVVDYDAQANGVAYGRYPDGAPSFYALSDITRDTNNAPPLQRDIVINELMYNPVSGDSSDEYVELYNRGTNTVDLSLWQFDDGISFTFPSGATVAPGGYVVVAKNAARLLANYPQLNANNTFGDYNGTLANGGERVALAMPDVNLTFITNGSMVTIQTNIIDVVVDEVTYGDGGRWGTWSDGGGSSLELKDPDSDNRRAANWADSDELAKSDGLWTTIDYTNVIGETLNRDGINNRLEVFTLGIGECLVDDLEVRNGAGTGGNALGTSGTFESGMPGWTLRGSFDMSTVESPGYNSARSLHLRAGSRGDNGPNLAFFKPLNPTASSPLTLRGKVRWLRGWPEILLRIHGGGIEVSTRLETPKNLGSPGLPNSRLVSNAGPAIWDVTHTSVLPAANEPVVVTARALDPDGIASVQLLYRIDPATSEATLNMLDDGTGGDAVAGDGLFSATLPGRSAGTLAAFHIVATDTQGARNEFPQDRLPTGGVPRLFPLDATSKECLVRWGAVQMPGSFATYHMWLTKANRDRWASRDRLNNAFVDCTFVYNNYRVIYNGLARFAGSPWHSGQMTSGPDGSQRTDFDFHSREDDLLLGQTDFVVNNPGNPGGGNFSDRSMQSEQTSYLIFKGIDVHYNYRRYVHMFVNGVQRSTTGNRAGNMLMEDSQQANRNVVEEWYPDGPDNELFKIEDWFEFSDIGYGHSNNDADLIRRTVTYDGNTVPHIGAYRFMWRHRARKVGQSASDYTNFWRLVDAVSPESSPSSPSVDVDAFESVANAEQWMRIFAVQHTVGNWDSYGFDRGKNAYMYLTDKGQYEQMTWDIDFTMGIGGRGSSEGLFGSNDPRVRAMWNTPAIRRMYLRAYKDILDGPFDRAFLDPILDAKAAAMSLNNVNYDPGQLNTIKNYVTARRNYIAGQISAVVNESFAVNGASAITTDNNLITLSGTAPIDVKYIVVNGQSYPVAWSGPITAPTTWTINLAVDAGVNVLNVRGHNLADQPIASAVDTVTVTYNGPVELPEDNLVINEIMYNPIVPDTSFVEIYNRSATFSFDLSGWRLNGTDFTFPSGTIITNHGYLVVAKSRAALIAAFGGDIPVAGEYKGNLDNDGETISLIKPGSTPDQDVVVSQVRYESMAPWPTSANGQGPSMQVLDSARDIRRASNWSDGSGWRTFSVEGTMGGGSTARLLLWLSSAGDLYVDNVSLVALDGPNAGTDFINNGDFEGPMAGSWTTFGNHSDSVISTDAAFSGSHSMHIIAGGVGGTTAYIWTALAGVDLTTTYRLTFNYLPTLNTDGIFYRVTSVFRATSAIGVQPTLATPGRVNATTQFLPAYDPLWINEVQANNLNGATDGQGEVEPWIELYNAGTSAIDLSGYYLADNFANLTQWQFPAGASIAAGEWMVIWTDGEPNETVGTTELHTSFRLPETSGAIALVRLVQGAPQIADYLKYNNLQPNLSYGDFPDGQPIRRQVFFEVTPGAANSSQPINLFINEWMASNTGFNFDPTDLASDDWFELYNPNTSPVNLGGFYLTDRTNNKTMFRIPDWVTIPAEGFLLVWADEDSSVNSSNLTALHVNFKLSAGGEQIGLFTASGEQVDVVTFGPQSANVSQGRFGDGAPGPFNFMQSPTPGAPNMLTAPNTPPVLAAIPDQIITLGQTVSFTASASDTDVPAQSLTFSLVPVAPANAIINPISGVFAWTPTEAQAPGDTTISVQVTDSGLPVQSAVQSFTVTVVLPPDLAVSQPAPGQVSMQFSTVVGKSYRVEYTESLAEPRTWTPLPGYNPRLADAATMTVDVTAGTTGQRFYRIVVLD